MIEVHRGIDGLVRKASIRYKEPVHDSGKKKRLYIPSKSKFALRSVRDLIVISRAEV